jgi:hypothetical protein
MDASVANTRVTRRPSPAEPSAPVPRRRLIAAAGIPRNLSRLLLRPFAIRGSFRARITADVPANTLQMRPGPEMFDESAKNSRTHRSVDPHPPIPLILQMVFCRF